MITWLKNRLTAKRRLRDELALAHHNLQKMREEYRADVRQLHESRLAHLGSLEKMEREKEERDKENGKLRAQRNVAWPRPPKRVPKNEVRRAFAVAPDAPLWVALNQELDDTLQDLLDDVSLPPSGTMTAETRLHLAGGVEHLRLFHKRLLDLQAAASQADADLDGEGGEESKK